MKVLTAKVVDGRLDVPEGSFKDGDTITVLVADADQGFRLSAADQALLLEAIAQMERGEGVDGWQLLDDLGA